jgi:L-asparaginase II
VLPVLCEVVRSGMVESRHRGSIVLLDAAGEPELVLGDGDAPVLPRSSLKPLQAVGMLRAGLGLTGAKLALACASHSGEPVHIDLCRSVLAGAGRDASALGNPPGLPLGTGAMEDLLRAGGSADPIHHNCSGKHAAMVATCVARDWPVAGYVDPEHPLQQAIRVAIEDLAGEPVGAVATDGCGAPAFAISLTGLARAFARLATAPAGTPEAQVAAAMRVHPGLVGGRGRGVTEMMHAVDGLVAKEGAEGVCAAALSDGRALALKVDDGARRALGPVVSAVLTRWDVHDAALDHWVAPVVLGGGAPVGELRMAASDILSARG